jgi:hypothetical protein
MKIAIVVPGRFFAFEMGGALLASGRDITVFTNMAGRCQPRDSSEVAADFESLCSATTAA